MPGQNTFSNLQRKINEFNWSAYVHLLDGNKIDIEGT